MADRSEHHELADGPFQPADLLAYQEGAVVSRTLLDTDGGTVTAFAFDEEERLTEHSAPHDALLQVLDGTASVTIAGESHEVRAGEAVVLPADVPHAVDAVTSFKMLLTMVR